MQHIPTLVSYIYIYIYIYIYYDILYNIYYTIIYVILQSVYFNKLRAKEKQCEEKVKNTKKYMYTENTENV